MCTSVASRVHGTTGEPCSSAPWWLRMMCSTAAARSAREARQLLDQPAHAVVAERDLALELAEVGQVDRERVGGVGLELADVVQQRAGQTATSRSMPGNVRRDRRDRLGDGQRVLEQAVAVRLVVALGGGRVAELRPRRRLRAEHRVEQRAQVRVLDRGDEVAQVLLHLVGVARRAVEQRGEVDLVGRRGAQRRGSRSRPVPSRVAALDAHRRAALVRAVVARARAARRPCRCGRRAHTTLVAAQLAPHQEDRVDVLSLGELAHDHGAKRSSAHRTVR